MSISVYEAAAAYDYTNSSLNNEQQYLVIDLDSYSAGICVCSKSMKTSLQHEYSLNGTETMPGDIINALKTLSAAADEQAAASQLETANRAMNNYLLSDRDSDNDPVMFRFSEDEILCNTGTYGVPEFGTAFVRGMLDETQPDTMEELLRISGLSHGTDVWLGNAQELIASGTATLSECVCCRDDIMNYLINMGCAPKMSFTTMESVRKGKGLKPEMEKEMVDHNVPDWFMDSCRKIKYMFPKGHAVAYVTMSLRVAWYKLHFPSAYYCSYFTVRGDGFDAGTMLIDPDTCRARIREIRNAEKPSAKEKEQQTSLELVLEMNMRGIRFLPVDLYKSDVRKFKIEGGDLRCPFTSLVGLGESVAESIVAARNQQPFVSIEDLQNRGHVGASIIEMLRQHGTLEGLDETSQISMF